MCLGVPGEIMNISEGADPLTRVAKVRFGGIKRDVNLAYTPEAKVGEYVIVHVGFAISILQENEANLVLQALRELGEMIGP